jgi:hypothetical protein
MLYRNLERDQQKWVPVLRFENATSGHKGVISKSGYRFCGSRTRHNQKIESTITFPHNVIVL